MIHSVLIFNNSGLPRLTKFYAPVDLATQQTLLKQVHSLLVARKPDACLFLTPPPLLQGQEDVDTIRVIYKHYATLYFVFVVDEQESELGILDLIQVMVECLDRCFENVCELDLVFGWQTLETVLGEIIQGGMVVETSVTKIVAAVDEANRGNGSQEMKEGGASGGFANALSGATSAISQMAKEGRWSYR